MPAFNAGFLIDVIIAGTALALALLLATAAGRVLRQALRRRQQRSERQIRPHVLKAITEDEVPPELISARGPQGRAAERVIFGYLQEVRGEARAVLVSALQLRGAVDKVVRRSHRRLPYQRARAAEQLGLIATPEAERRLRLLVADASEEVRVVATRALGKTDSAEAAAELLRSLSQADTVPQGIIASALLELGPEAAPALRAALSANGGDNRQQAMAAEVLGLMDDMPAWKLLAENLASRDLEVRVSAVRALGRLGLPQAIVPVTACLAPAENAGLRAVAARALGEIGDPRAVPALAACLDEPHYWVAHNAAQALAVLGPVGVDGLERAVQDRRAGMRHAREALARAALARGELPPPPLGGPDGTPEPMDRHPVAESSLRVRTSR